MKPRQPPSESLGPGAKSSRIEQKCFFGKDERDNRFRRESVTHSLLTEATLNYE
jgi:hypothetical protein